jgi:hypothetical protein
MLAHFIPHKGKGMLVPGLPLVTAVILFMIFDGFNLNDKYIAPLSFIISSFIIWFYDEGPALLREGIGNTAKSRHALFWIEIKYWAIVLGMIGCVLLGNAL